MLRTNIRKYSYLFFISVILLNCSSLEDRDHYISVIKSYPNYNNQDSLNSFEFYYADTSDSNLSEIRNKFNLSKIATNGSEISQIINLMNWVHETLSYEGSSSNPNPRNSINIIETCKDEDRGINCRMYATVLNEVYLSMGWNSRFVTCLPEDKSDKDCHVINIVFSNSLNKWIYMDPTYNTFITDENKNYLNVQEIRKKLVNEEPILLSENFNLNLENTFLKFGNALGFGIDKDLYLTYMTKNLFRVRCSMKSEFNYETNKERSDIELVPSGYKIIENPFVKKSKGKIITRYYTNNSDLFWVKPI